MMTGKHYKKLTLSDGTKRDEHRYIMEQKVGRKLGFNEIVHHDDEVKTNNSEDNLKVMSRSEHSRLHAETRVYGEGFSNKMRQIGINTMPNRKLTEVDVLLIRELNKSGFVAPEIQKMFSIGRRTVYDIISKTTWKHI